MCNKNCIDFGIKYIKKDEILKKRIIEIGANDINGSLKKHILQFSPSEYIGTDIVDGKNVDIICSAYNLFDKFEKESFDGLICTEVLEHVENWRLVISNFKNIIKSDGFLLITTRSKGFRFHGYPYDYWRYEEEDFKFIFSDLNIIFLEKDSISPGIFVKAIKPKNFIEKDLSEYQLYSIKEKRKVI